MALMVSPNVGLPQDVHVHKHAISAKLSPTKRSETRCVWSSHLCREEQSPSANILKEPSEEKGQQRKFTAAECVRGVVLSPLRAHV